MRVKKLLGISIIYLSFCINFVSAENIKNLYVVDARNLSLSDKLTLVSIQGIANRNSKKEGVFIILRFDDVKWLNDIVKRRRADIKYITKEELLEKFKTLLSGQIIYDKNALYTVNIATTLAGIKNAFITESPVKGFDIVFDCRNKWKNKIEGYRWAIKNLLKDTSKKMAAILEEKITSLRDFIIQEKVFVFDLDPINNKKEIDLIKEILSRYKPTTPIIGWPDAKYADKSKGQNNVSVEVAFVELISPRNIFLVASDFACNLSVYKKLKAQFPFIQVRKKEFYDPNRVYLTFVYSDGDNIQYVLNHMRSGLWDDTGRLKLPIGWTIAPLLYDWGSFILEKYYADAYFSGNDEFVMGPSGFGYVHPTRYNDINTFLKLTKEYGEKLDLSTVAIIDEGHKDEMLKTYKKFAKQTFLKTIFVVGDIGVRKLSRAEDAAILVLSEDFRANFVEQNVSTIRRLVGSGKKMIYCYAHAWDIRPSQLVEIIRKVSDLNIKVVTPSTFSDLWYQKVVCENDNKNEENSERFYEVSKKVIYNIKHKWKIINGIHYLSITCDLPVDATLNAEVVYWFDNDMEKKYFQYLQNRSKGSKFIGTLPPIYKGKKLYYYINVITRDLKIKKSIIKKVDVKFYSDSDKDGLNNEFEEKILKTSPLSKDSDKDGLFDKNDFDPLRKLVDEKIVFELSLNNESKYLWKDYKSLKATDGHRYADNDTYFIYKIPLRGFVSPLVLGVILDNNYVVEVSTDGKNFKRILKSSFDCHDGSNKGLKKWKIPDTFIKSGVLFIKISDGSPQDGWGGGFFGAKIFSKWGDLKILNITAPINIFINKKNIIKTLVANKYKIKKYSVIVEFNNNQIKLKSIYDKENQLINSEFIPTKSGKYIFKIRVEDEKGNFDNKEKILFVKKEKGNRTKLIKETKVLNKEWNYFGGWNESECGGLLEKKYLYKNSGTAIDSLKHRFADSKNFCIYKFSSPTSIGILEMKLGNNFVVSISTNLKDWVEVLNSYKIYGEDIHNLSNYDKYFVDISKYLKKKNKIIYVRVGDASPSDGWGGNIGYIKLGVPPVFKNNERVLVEVTPINKDVFVMCDCSSIYNNSKIISEKSPVDLFDNKKYSSNKKYVSFFIPSNTSAGIFPIKIIGEFQDIKYSVPLYIGIYNKKINFKVKKTKKTNIMKNILKSLGEYFNNFGSVISENSVMVNKDFILSNKMKEYFSGWGEGKSGTAEEVKYLEVAGGSINSVGFRFADGSVFFSYKFDLPSRFKLVVAEIWVGNNFVISVYNNNTKKWKKVLVSQNIYNQDIHNMSNYKPYYINVTDYLGKGKKLRIKFSDNSPNDGWGPCVGNIKIYIR